jgi:hypothetical protein
VPRLPTYMRCPHAGCGHKRLLGAQKLQVESEEDYAAWLDARMRKAQQLAQLVAGGEQARAWLQDHLKGRSARREGPQEEA